MNGIGSYFGGDYTSMSMNPYAQFTAPAAGDSLGQTMLAFLSQAGVLDQATGMVDKAKFTKYYNDTQALQNQLDASTWSNLKTMADAWAR